MEAQRHIPTIDEAAAKIAADWPPLTETQKDELARVLGTFVMQPANPLRSLGRAA